MYLKSIEISGFKSFAKKVELDFASAISAIVGPNGSGKSNIAESFRFVLGEQSIKSLRGKRGEDLIWNGSTEMPRAGKASVKVTFDNSSRFLSLDFDQVVIERAVHRDGVNEYFLNGSQVRLKDVIELLAGAHIGSSGHHIISQGEADRILNASIKERKTMIEEALGLKVYQYKKTESLKKLEKTRENIAQVESLRREIAPHIRFLKKQVEKVEKAAEMKKELLAIAGEYVRLEAAYIAATTRDLRNEREPIEEKLETARREVAAAKAVLAQAETRDGRSDELLKLESDIRTARSAKDELSRDMGKVEGELAAAARLIKKQEEQARSKDWKTVEMRAVEDLRTEILEYVDMIEHSTDPGEIKKAVDAIRSLFKAFVEMRSDATDTGIIREAQAEIERLNAERNVIEKKIADLSRQESATERAYNDLRTQIESEKETNREAEKKLFQSMGQEQAYTSELHSVRAKEETLAIVEADYKRDVGELSVMLGHNFLHTNNTNNEATETVHDRVAQKERRQKIEKLKLRLEDSGAAGGDEVLKEYTESVERDAFLERELTDLSASAASLQSLITELEEKISVEFDSGLEKINKQFKEFFSLMFGGGDAELAVIKATPRRRKSVADELIEAGSDSMPDDAGDGVDGDADGDAQDESGIDISVSLPKKKVKGLIQLSGGERALTSIALLFAISQVNPPPFIILDETDAALDESNSRKYGDMIETLGKFSQLIVITHNRETMSRAGALYGVTMGSGGVSKLLTVAFEEAVAVAK